MIKQLIATTLSIITFTAVSAEEFLFDFHNPSTLTPAIDDPGEKKGFELDGITFTEGNVSIKFTAAKYGNTDVRLYHSYDAGIDLRLYDGDNMTVSTDNTKYISKIRFTMSLSGAASGSNDINFLPSTGEFIWEDECWIRDADTQPQSIDLTSELQSRIYTITVTVEESTSLSQITPSDSKIRYFSILGNQILPTQLTHGVYIREHNGIRQKIILR